MTRAVANAITRNDAGGASMHTVETAAQSKQRTEMPLGCMARISSDSGTLPPKVTQEQCGEMARTRGRGEAPRNLGVYVSNHELEDVWSHCGLAAQGAARPSLRPRELSEAVHVNLQSTRQRVHGKQRAVDNKMIPNRAVV